MPLRALRKLSANGVQLLAAEHLLSNQQAPAALDLAIHVARITICVAGAQQANWGAKRSSSGLRPRDAALATTSGAAQAPAAKEAKVAGRSMSALLQSRSEAAAVERKAAGMEPCSPMPDIDAADKADPLQAAEYVGDIFTYYRRVEPQFRVSPDYMTQQVLSLRCALLLLCLDLCSALANVVQPHCRRTSTTRCAPS